MGRWEEQAGGCKEGGGGKRGGWWFNESVKRFYFSLNAPRGEKVRSWLASANFKRAVGLLLCSDVLLIG